MTIGELQKIYTYPQVSDTTIALEDFFVLLAHVTGQTKTFLLAHPEYTLRSKDETKLKSLIERRLSHEPVAYLTGHKEFYGRDFLVTPATLIPRPETEVLIEKIVAYLQNISSPTTVLDIGTGSGAIILTLAEELDDTNFQFIGTDISLDALEIAKKNQKLLQNTSVTFQQSDLLTNVTLPKKHLCIVANLPYVPEKMYQETEPDVRNFEPMLALVSGDDGLDHYRRMIREIRERNLTNFSLFLEIDPSQTTELIKLLSIFDTMSITVIKDLTDRERFIQITL